MSFLSRVKEWVDAEVLEANELNAEFDAIVDNIVAGTTAAVGLVQLEDSHASTSTTKAACPKNVKEAYDLAGTMLTKAAFDAGTFMYAVNDNTPVKKTRAEILALLSGQSGADFSMGTHKITAVTDPTANQDAATKKYVDDNSGGMSSIVEDTTPQLGGNLDMNGKSIGGNTEAQLDDAVSKKHAANGDTDLDATFEATFMKKADNVNALADITSTGANIEDAVTKKHAVNSDTALGAQSENLDMNTHKVVGVVDPTANQDAATKKYADDCKVNKTTGAWSKSVGSGGDYADWATMIAAMPDMIAHAVTVTIKAGTTLTEICNLKNKHGLTVDAAITIQAEKYFPTSGELPTADSATTTTLRDAALATAALGNDYFNGCWVFVVGGTGTDNGFVAITDYVDATGDVVVASWPGTQPDNTSRYMIVGALIDGQSARSYCVHTESNTVHNAFYGIGFKAATLEGFYCRRCVSACAKWCGAYGIPRSGFYVQNASNVNLSFVGAVGCNTSNDSARGGISIISTAYGYIVYNGISDNLQRGFLLVNGGFSLINNSFGDSNGVWGTYAQHSAQARLAGTECSGSSGNHSNGAGDGSLAYS